MTKYYLHEIKNNTCKYYFYICHEEIKRKLIVWGIQWVFPQKLTLEWNIAPRFTWAWLKVASSSRAAS